MRSKTASIAQSLPQAVSASQMQEEIQTEQGPLEDLLVGFEDFDLDQVDLEALPTEAKPDPFLWGPGIHLIQSIPEADISLYAPLSAHELSGVLIRYGEQLYKFDWNYSRYLFHAAWADFDHDGNCELAVGICTMYGTALFHEELHIVRLGENGQAEDFPIPEELYKKELTSKLSCEADYETNQISVGLNDVKVQFPPILGLPTNSNSPLQIQPIYNIISYMFADGVIIADYGIPVYCEEKKLPELSASVEAYVSFNRENEFGLYNLSLKVDAESD